MANLKGRTQRPAVRAAAIEAERWFVLGEATTFERYTQLTEDLIEKYPRSYQEEKDLMNQAKAIQKEQAYLACSHTEDLIAMAYLQKARLEAWASNDNWARDALGVVDANIASLIRTRDALYQAYRNYSLVSSCSHGQNGPRHRR